MRNFLTTRLIHAVITLFIVSFIVFFMVRLRGDPITVMAPPTLNQEQIAALRASWGFDRPLLEQYAVFLQRAIVGDFGQSFQSRRPATELVLERLGLNFVLAASSALFGLVIALPLGIISALNRNSWIDFISTVFSSLGTAMPSFWLGLILIIIFSVNLRILPAFGALEPAAIIMPTITLGVGMAARLSRITRSAMLEVLNQDYVRTAYSKGLHKRVVITRHTLRNALIPIVTIFGLQLGWLLGGSVIVESVFAWPGLGRLMLDSIGVRDTAVVQAALLWFAISFIVINLIVDLLYIVLDPRIRYH